jgi:hypothetical protein
MGTDSPRRAITARVLRSKADAETAADAETRQQTMEQRIATVWYLTLQCMAWNRDEGKGDADQPRLARSVCRIERRRG